MGESRLEPVGAQERIASCAGVQTVGGRVQVRWESESAATPMGQLAYFIEFLTLTGLWSRWQEGYPLRYVSPNAPSKAEVLGTWMLSILSGHRRYAHVTAIRCDGVNPGLLGMNKVISEDALCRALAANPRSRRRRLAGPAPGGKCGAVARCAVDSRHRHGGAAAGRRRRGQGGRCALGQPQPAGAAEDTRRPLAPQTTEAGARRLRFRLRHPHGSAGGAATTLPVQAQALEERQTSHRAHLLGQRLVRCRSGLGRQGRQPASVWLAGAAARRGVAPPAPGRSADCAGP